MITDKCVVYNGSLRIICQLVRGGNGDACGRCRVGNWSTLGVDGIHLYTCSEHVAPVDTRKDA